MVEVLPEVRYRPSDRFAGSACKAPRLSGRTRQDFCGAFPHRGKIGGGSHNCARKQCARAVPHFFSRRSLGPLLDNQKRDSDEKTAGERGKQQADGVVLDEIPFLIVLMRWRADVVVHVLIEQEW